MSETSKQANMQIPICLKFVFVKKFAYADRIIKKIRSDHNQLYMHFPRLTTISAHYLPLKCRSIYILSEQKRNKNFERFQISTNYKATRCFYAIEQNFIHSHVVCFFSNRFLPSWTSTFKHTHTIRRIKRKNKRTPEKLRRKNSSAHNLAITQCTDFVRG